MLILLTALSACGGPDTTPTISESPAPATTPMLSVTLPTSASTNNAPSPVSATLVAATRVPPVTPGNVGNSPQDLSSAVARTREAAVFRFDIAWNVTRPQASQSITGKGENNNRDQHLTYSGVQPNTGKTVIIEMLRANNRNFIKGFAFTPTTDNNAWYEIPAQMGNIQKSTPNPKDVFLGVMPDDFLADIKITGNENMDGQACQVWTGSSATLAKGLTAWIQNLQASLGVVDHFEVKLWACADGYLHQVHVALAGHNSKTTDDKADIQITNHFYGFNATDITITSPSNALPLPSFGPTPTAQP